MSDNVSTSTEDQPMDEQSTATASGEIPEDRFAMLMKAAQAGDQNAYIHLMREVTPRVRLFVVRSRGFLAAEDVEDLVQDVLLSLHAVRATYDSRRPFMPWLFAIARNRLADGARRYARKAAREINTDYLDVTFPAENANIKAEAYGDHELLIRAIQRLPAAQRTAIEMLKLRELSLKEAATASRMSIGALKVATHRAMTTLRKMLVKEDESKY